MQKGPTTQQQAEQEINAVRAKLLQRVETLKDYIVRKEDGTVDGAITLQGQVSFLQILAKQNGVTLNQKQAKKMLQQASATAADILAEADMSFSPHVIFAFQLAIATGLLGFAMWQPGMAGSVIAFEGTRRSLHGLLDGKLGSRKRIIEAALALIEFQYSIRTFGSTAVLNLIEKYGTLGYLAIPTSIVLIAKGPELLAAFNNSHVVKAMGDLTDIMGGFADDDVYEQYRGSLATMTMEDMASSVSSTLSWLWSKTPSFRSGTAPTIETSNSTLSASTSQRLK